MKNGWTYRKLGEVCEVTDFVANGSFATLRKNVTYYNEPNYAVLVRLADFTSNFDIDKFVYVDEKSYDFLAKSKLYGGEIIMSNVGSIGKCFLCPKVAERMTIGPNSLLIRTPFNEFYLYYFRSEPFQKNLRTITSSATLSKFNKTQLKTLSIPVPPLSEQQQIVDRLDSAFAKIDAVKANAEKQLNDAKALFQKELSKAMTPKEGWEKKKLVEIGDVIGGTTPNTNNPDYWDGDICWISPAELHGERYLYDSVKKITQEAVNAKSLKELPVGTVILSSRAPIGKVAINKVPMYCNQGFKCIVCGKEVYNEFLYWWLWGNTDYLNSLGTGATFKEISKSVVEKIQIPIPPLSEQQAIASHLDTLSEKLKTVEERQKAVMAECDAMKQALLREVF